MKTAPLIVSHYTVNTGYQAEVQNLINSLNTFKLNYAITATANLGSWRANSNFVASNVLRALEDNPGRDILRVDADAVFFERPTVFEQDGFDADIAAVVHSFRWRQNELMGGTLYFRNCPEVIEFVRQWERTIRKDKPLSRPGDAIQHLLAINEFQLKFVKLPPSYCKIFDHMKDVEGDVIVHYQASRRFKQAINTSLSN